MMFNFSLVHLRLRYASASNLPKRINYGKVVSFTLVVPVILPVLSMPFKPTSIFVVPLQDRYFSGRLEIR